jgi:hypothetical protein
VINSINNIDPVMSPIKNLTITPTLITTWFNCDNTKLVNIELNKADNIIVKTINL